MPLSVNDFQLATMAYFAERPLMPEALYLLTGINVKEDLSSVWRNEIRGEVLFPSPQLLIVMNEEITINIFGRAVEKFATICKFFYHVSSGQ